MQDYDRTLEVVRELTDGEEKMKKIANSHNLTSSLTSKIKEVDLCLTKLTQTIEEKVKHKNQLENEKMRLEEHIEAKRKDLAIIQHGIDFIEGQIKEEETSRKSLEEQLGDNRRGALPHPREELKRVRAKMRAAEMEKMELLSKLQESIRDIRDFALIICKTLANSPELVPSTEE